MKVWILWLLVGSMVKVKASFCCISAYKSLKIALKYLSILQSIDRPSLPMNLQYLLEFNQLLAELFIKPTIYNRKYGLWIAHKTQEPLVQGR